jgi:hypothetical protein
MEAGHIKTQPLDTGLTRSWARTLPACDLGGLNWNTAKRPRVGLSRDPGYARFQRATGVLSTGIQTFAFLIKPGGVTLPCRKNS